MRNTNGIMTTDEFINNTNTSIDSRGLHDEMNSLRQQLEEQTIRLRQAEADIQRYRRRLAEASRELTECQKAKKSLQASEQQYRLVFENISDALFLLEVTVDGRFCNLAINPAFEQAVGIPATQLIGQYIDEAVDDDTARAVIAKYRHCVETGVIGEYEVELTLPIGRRWFRSTLIPVRDNTEQISRIVGMTRDITTRKTVEQQLTLLNFAIDHVNEAAFLSDEHGRFLYVNARACRTLRYDRQELLGMTASDIVVDFPGNDWRAHVRELKAKGSLTFETRHKAKDGVVFPVEINVSHFEYDGAAYILALARDVTDRKRMENALQTSEEKFRTVFESANDGIFLHRIVERDGDSEFVLVDLNQKGCEFWGYSREDILSGKVNLLALGDPPYTFEEATRRNRIAAAGQPLLFDWHLTRRDGSKVWGEVSLRRIRICGEAFLLSVIRDVSGRKAMEEALRSRKENFRALAENSPDIIVRYDRAGKRVYVNPAFEALVDKPTSELIGKTPAGAFIISPAFGQQIQEAVERVLGTGAPTEIEIMHDTVKGTVKYIHVRYVPEFGQDGRLTGVLSIGRDITTLRETELSLTKLAEISPGQMGTLLLRPDGAFCMPYTSPRIWDIYGVRPEDVMQDASALFDRIHPDDAAGVMASIAESARTLTPWHHEFRLRHPERGEIWVEGHSTPRRQPDGSTIWYGFIHDITERKWAEEALLRAKEEWERTFDAVPDLIAIIDADYRIIRANKAMTDALGQPPEKCLGQRCYTALHGLGAPPAFCPHRQLMRDRQTHTAEVFEERLQGHFLVTVAPLFDPHNNVIGSVHIARNINEQKRVEKQLQQTAAAAAAANRIKSEFLANMSHEIRTPMNAILGFAEILEGKIADVQQRQYVTNIRASGKTLLRLINDILDLSKIEAGKLDIQDGAVNVRLVCQDVAQIFSQTVSEKGLDFMLEMAPDLPEYLLFDEIRLRQILLNLVGNAVKFTEQGKVTLEVTNVTNVEEDDLKSQISNLKFKISDTGIGIPEDQWDAIFGAFDQIHGQSRQYGGTGLGLAITKRLVEMMGGVITVTSAVGQGSTFTVRFPHVRSAEGSKPVSPPSVILLDAVRFDQATILIVDDVPDNRLLLRSYLEKYGLTSIEAANGQDAIALAVRTHPDLILMDLRMPVMSGYDAARTIKRSEITRNIPVIAVTGTAMKESATEILAVCEGYLSKPVEQAALLAELIKFLSYTLVPKNPAPEALAQRTTEIGNHRPVLPPETLERLPEVRQMLETVWLPQWQEFRAALIMDDVKHFAVELAQFARDYQLQFLLDYTERLLQHARSYDISGLKKCLAEFPGYVEQLKSIAIRNQM